MQFTVRASLRPATGDLGKDRSVALDDGMSTQIQKLAALEK
jgi:hypothetical protein